MDCCCPTKDTGGRVGYDGSPVNLSVAAAPVSANPGRSGVAQMFVTEMAGFTVEVAYQRSQGRRDHQEDMMALCSLDTKSSVHIRHDDMFGTPGKFSSNPEVKDLNTQVDPDVQWFGVYDGHGGDLVSELAAGTMHLDFLEKAKNLLPAEKTPDILMNLFGELFAQFDDKVLQLPVKTVMNERNRMVTKSSRTSGSTCSVMALHKLSEEDALITVAHAGDSRVLVFSLDNPPKDHRLNSGGPERFSRTSMKPKQNLFKRVLNMRNNKWMGGTNYETFASTDLDVDNVMLPLTRRQSRRLRKILKGKFGRSVSVDHVGEIIYESLDHQPSNRSEAQRVIAKGGSIINNRVNGVLAVSRALGDADQKIQGGLTVAPDTYAVSFTDLFGRPARIKKTRSMVPPSDTLRTTKSHKAGKPAVNMTEEVDLSAGKEVEVPMAELELNENKKKKKSKREDDDDEEEDQSLNKDVIIVMASDGLWMYYSSQLVKGDLVELLARGFTLQQACQVLMDKVIIDAKGVDNTAIVIIRISKTRATGRSVSIGSFGSFIDVNKIRESAAKSSEVEVDEEKTDVDN